MRDVYEAVLQMVFEAWQACYEPLADRDAFIETMVIPLSRSTGVAIGKIHYYEASLNILSPRFLNLVIEARDQASRVLSVCESILDDKDVDLNTMERMAAARPFDPYQLIPPIRQAIMDYIARTVNQSAVPVIEAASVPGGRGKKNKGDKKTKGKDIDPRMVAIFMKNPDCIDWSCKYWSDLLDCSESSIIDAPTWTKIMNLRTIVMAEKETEKIDRRKRKKKSDSE